MKRYFWMVALGAVLLYMARNRKPTQQPGPVAEGKPYWDYEGKTW